MKQKTYKVNVKLQKGGHHGYDLVVTQVTALSPYQAQQLVEALYGKGSMIGLPQEVR